MTIRYFPKWGQKPLGKMTPSELTQHMIRNSEMFVFWAPGEMLYMELIGEIAKVPNTKKKESGPDGIHFMAKSTVARLSAMDQLFARETRELGRVTFPNDREPLFLSIMISDELKGTDAVAVAETIQDWFEPSTKEKGGKSTARGWGVGVYENDDRVVPLPVPSELITADPKTVIRLCKFERVKPAIADILVRAMV